MTRTHGNSQKAPLLPNGSTFLRPGIVAITVAGLSIPACSQASGVMAKPQGSASPQAVQIISQRADSASQTSPADNAPPTAAQSEVERLKAEVEQLRGELQRLRTFVETEIKGMKMASSQASTSTSGGQSANPATQLAGQPSPATPPATGKPQSTAAPE